MTIKSPVETLINPDSASLADTRPTSRSSGATAWALQVLLGVTIAGGGLAKIAGDPAMVEMFADIGAGQWLRVVIGGLEVAGGVGLLIRRVRAVAALCLVVLLLGASATNVAVLDTSPLLALVLAAAALVIL